LEFSNLIRNLRITFLTVGFLLFVVMAVHWVQHVSTAKPVLAPRVIAVIPSVNKAAAGLQDSSFASFVQAAPSDAATQPAADSKSNSASPEKLHPAPVATENRTVNQGVSPEVKSSKPVPVPQPVTAHDKSKDVHGPYPLTTPRDY
jgi:hypothetical protein